MLIIINQIIVIFIIVIRIPPIGVKSCYVLGTVLSNLY